MAPAAEEGGGAALGVEDMPDDMQVHGRTVHFLLSCRIPYTT